MRCPLSYLTAIDRAAMKPKTPTAHTGKNGETLAAEYLIAKGYTIVETNWRCRFGEIDIVARQGESLIFVEVRTRRTATEDAFASIDPRKREKMQRAAYLYLAEHQSEHIPWQIDVIAVALPYNSTPIIEHLENALDW